MLSIKYIPYVRKSSPSRSSEMGKTCFMGYGRLQYEASIFA